MTLGEKIQQLRKASGISQEQLAEQLGVSRQSVSKWELDDAVPEIGKVVMLSDLFSISTDELLKDNYAASKPGQPEGESSETAIEQIVKMNQANKQINMGFKTLITGLIALVLVLVLLPVLGIASVPPMPVLPLIGVVIVVGLFLMMTGYSHKR